ncbi:hypothetical protein GEA64_03665 [Photorhabdus khanii]|uniref:Uncharacterized protein n=2 Tax=Morganellaceae TaxID=1903414 RepID=A0A7C9KBW5_9GAMM|nr:hypothetical protein [Photorhabdus khanii]
MIVMFSGSSIPDGWALCDGKTDGTPNLINRFIMGGTTQDINGHSSNLFSGNKNDKKFTFTSENQSVHIRGNTEGHSLTPGENGKHSHIQGETYEYHEFCHHDYHNAGRTVFVSGGGTGSTEPTYAPHTAIDGNGDPHSHPINLTSGEHNHKNNVTVPYYILAFIMKL